MTKIERLRGKEAYATSQFFGFYSKGESGIKRAVKYRHGKTIRNIRY